MRKGQKMPESVRLQLIERLKGNKSRTGQHCSEEHKRKARESNLGKKHNISPEGLIRLRSCRSNFVPWNKGKNNVYSNETLEKMKMDKLGKRKSKETCLKMSIARTGEKNHNWNGGVNMRDKHSLFNPEYREWRMKIFTRDNFKCKIENKDCVEKIQAHHILNWKDYPELRYDTNNGITLCLYHHPRGREKEKLMSPYFKKLISQIN